MFGLCKEQVTDTWNAGISLLCWTVTGLGALLLRRYLNIYKKIIVKMKGEPLSETGLKKTLGLADYPREQSSLWI